LADIKSPDFASLHVGFGAIQPKDDPLIFGDMLGQVLAGDRGQFAQHIFTRAVMHFAGHALELSGSGFVALGRQGGACGIVWGFRFRGHGELPWIEMSGDPRGVAWSNGA